MFLAIELVFVVIFIVIAVRAISGQSLPNVGWSTLPMWNSSTVTARPDRRCIVHRGAELPWLRRHFDAGGGVDGRENPAGRAMIIALFVVAFLFVIQTWLASLLAGGREAFSDDEAGNAFFTLVQAASNTGWMNAFFAVNVMAVGFANAMAAQAATSRLLYSMSRDGQLPKFLSTISRRKVPIAAHPGRQRAQRRAGAVLRRSDRH